MVLHGRLCGRVERCQEFWALRKQGPFFLCSSDVTCRGSPRRLVDFDEGSMRLRLLLVMLATALYAGCDSGMSVGDSRDGGAILQDAQPQTPRCPHDAGAFITTASCCKDVRDFPNTCVFGGANGACGVCSAETRHPVKFCICGGCFDGTKCVPFDGGTSPP